VLLSDSARGSAQRSGSVAVCGSAVVCIFTNKFKTCLYKSV
jgi:hypothetical protein